MKRITLLVLIAAVALFALPAVAMAAGYDEPVSGQSPHQGWTSTSDQCKQCHAVHKAIGNRNLLRSMDSRYNDCAYCHLDGNAATGYDVYTGAVVNGHTMGSFTSKTSTNGARSARYSADGRIIIPDNAGGTTNYRGGSISVSPSQAAVGNQTSQEVTAVAGGGLRTNTVTTFNCNGCHMAHANPSKTITWEFRSLNPNARTRNTAGLFTYYGPDAPDIKKEGEATYTAIADGRLVGTDDLTNKILVRNPNDVGSPTGYNYSELTAVASGSRLSALTQWCADCHNLNVAGPGMVGGDQTGGSYYESASGLYSHSTYFSESGQTRENAIPNSKMGAAYLGGAPACFNCHVGSDQAWGDWPHSGGDGSVEGTSTSYALLKPLKVKSAPSEGAPSTTALAYDGTDATGPNVAGLDGVCRSCHAVLHRDPGEIVFDNNDEIINATNYFDVMTEMQP